MEKALAIFENAALGDAIGMPWEGMHPTQIMRYTKGKGITGPVAPRYFRNTSGNIIYEDVDGRIPYISVNSAEGDWSDDTKIKMPVAESIAHLGRLDLRDTADRSMAVYLEEKDKPKTGGDTHAFGYTTETAFQNLCDGISPELSGVDSRNPGNGPLLKTDPIGLYMYVTGKYQEGLDHAEKVGRMTHLDPRSVAGGVVQAHAVYTLLSGCSRTEFLDYAYESCAAYERSEEMRKKVLLKERIDNVRKLFKGNPDANLEDALHVTGNGWAVTRNYPLTLAAFRIYWENPRKGIIDLMNLGDDCDSTGAMFGALSGAKDGLCLPFAWSKKLYGRDRLHRAARGIYTLKI